MVFIYNALSILTFGKICKRKDKRKVFLIFAFIQMLLIQGLRSYEVGTDTLMYVNTYRYGLNSEYYSFLLTHFEFGFKLLYQILHFVKFDFQGMIFAISFLTLLFFFIFINENSMDVYLSIFIYACMFYPNSFNIMRQYLAASIAINSVTFIKKDKYSIALLLIIFASFFHITAVLFVTLIILAKIKNWGNIQKILLGLIIFIYLYGDKLLSFILPLIGKKFYLSGFSANRLIRLTTIIVFIIALLLNYFITCVDIKYKKELKFYSCIAFINFCFGVLYLKMEYFSRIIELFNLFVLVSIPLGIVKCKSYYRPIIRIALYVVPFLLMLNAVYNSSSGIENYHFF